MCSLPGGFLSVRVLRGINLVSCDAKGSDPYVVLTLDSQKLKTSVMKKTVNPVWNEDLTLAVLDASAPIKLEVFDKDTFSKDDRMGDAEFDIEALVQIIQMDLEDIRSGTVVRTVRPGGKDSCLAVESHIVWDNGQVVQDLLLKLRNVDTGVVHLQLKWVTIPALAWQWQGANNTGAAWPVYVQYARGANNSSALAALPPHLRARASC